MRDDTALIDPDGRYVSQHSGLRLVEERALDILAHLQAPAVTRTRDAIEISSGGEKGVVLLVTAEALELRLPTVEWTHGSHGPADASRLWRRVEWEDLQPGEYGDLIGAAMNARQMEFRQCKYCKREFPPEHRESDDVCHGCSERHEGVVH